MFKSILTLVLVVLFLGTACGPSERSAKDEAETRTMVVTPEEQYVQDVKEIFPASVDAPDEELISFGESLCSSLDEGYTFQGILLAGAQDGGSEKKMTKLLRVTVPALCPEHEKAMKLNLQ